MKEVPVVRIEDMSDAEKRAYVIADKQLALNAGWDEELLALDFKDLSDLEFEIEITGFDRGEIDVLIAKLNFYDSSDEDEVPEVPAGPAIMQLGDVWQMGITSSFAGKPHAGKPIRPGSANSGHGQTQQVVTDRLPSYGRRCVKPGTAIAR